MKSKYYRLHMFKPGLRTASNGLSMEFSESILSEVADTFTPQRRVPMTLGHNPAGHMPSLGWVKDCLIENDELYTIIKSTPAGTALLDNKYYDNISASFYPPNYVANPTPGKWSLRHVAALGADPPALKDLDPILEIVMDYSEIEDPELVAHFEDVQQQEEVLSSFAFSEAAIVPITWDFSTARKYGRVFNCKPGLRRCGGRCIPEDHICHSEGEKEEKETKAKKSPKEEKKSEKTVWRNTEDGSVYKKKKPKAGVDGADYDWKGLAKGLGAAAVSVGLKVAANELAKDDPMMAAAADVGSKLIMGQIVLNEDVDVNTRISKALYDGLTGSLETGISSVLNEAGYGYPAKTFASAATRSIDTAVGSFLFNGKIDGTASAIANSLDFTLTSGYRLLKEDPTKGGAASANGEEVVTKKELAEAIGVLKRDQNDQVDSVSKQVKVIRNKQKTIEKILTGLDKDLEGLDANQLTDLLHKTLTQDPATLTEEELRRAQAFLSLPIYMRLAQYLERGNPEINFSEGEDLSSELVDEFFNSKEEETTTTPDPSLSLESLFNFSEISELNSVALEEEEGENITSLEETFLSEDTYLDDILEEEPTTSTQSSGEVPPQEVEHHEVAVQPESRRNKPVSSNDFIDPNAESAQSIVERLTAKVAEMEARERKEWLEQRVAPLFSEAKIMPGRIKKEDLVNILYQLDMATQIGVVNFSESGGSRQINPVDVIIGAFELNEPGVSPPVEVADFSESLDTAEMMSFSEGFTKESQVLSFKIEKLMGENPTLSYARAWAIASGGGR